MNVYDLPTTEKIVRYLHAALGFPTKATVLLAIRKDWLIGWPSLTTENTNAYFPESNKTQDGHMKQQRQGVRSTKEKEKEEESQANAPEEVKKKHKDIYVKV